jgi:hypothetical protein
MRIRLIVVWYDGQDVPEVAHAWDDYTYDENPEGFEETLAKAKKDVGEKGEVRVGIVRVPNDWLEGLFKPVEVGGKVIEG